MISSLQGEGRGYISIKACAVGSRSRNGGSDMKAMIKYPGSGRKGDMAETVYKAKKNGSKGARTLGLPLVRRALIPAELCFHIIYYNRMAFNCKRFCSCDIKK